MSKDSQKRCTHCENIDANSLFDKGNGKCRECKGTGHDQHAEALVQFSTLGQDGDYYSCKTCAGTGQCQTCGGTGYEYYYNDDTSYSSENSSSSTSGSDLLGKVIGFLIVAAIAIWFVFSVAIPLIIINIAVISLIVGWAQKKLKIFLFPVSFLGAIFIVIDYNKGYFTKTLVNNVSFLDGVIPIFFYLNIIAGLAAAYFLIRDFINKQNPSVEDEGEFTQRNLLIMGCLLLIGVLTIVFVKRYGLGNEEIIQSAVTDSPSTTSTTDHYMDGKIIDKVNEYLQRNMQSSVEYVSSIYADKVDFYNSGSVDKNFIIIDKRNYFKKWPERNMTLTSNVDVTRGSEGNTWIASFNYHYQVKSNKRNHQGNAWCNLIFREDNNSLLIISEKGRVY